MSMSEQKPIQTPLQADVEIYRNVRLGLAGFQSDHELTDEQRAALDAYCEAYGNWYRSQYGENGNPRGSILRVMTDEEDRTLQAWRNSVAVKSDEDEGDEGDTSEWE